MKYICVCLLMGQIFVTPVLSYAEEIDQSTGNNVSEGNKTNPLTDSEDTSNQSGELDEEDIIDGNVKNKNAINQSEDTNKENKAMLKVKDSTLYVGDKWVSEDNFFSATDKDGNKLTVGNLEVEGTVDTSTAGVYEITYKNGSLSEIAKVKVEAKQTGSITLRYIDTYGNPVKDPVDGGGNQSHKQLLEILENLQMETFIGLK